MLEIEIHLVGEKSFLMKYECKEEAGEGWKSCFGCEFKRKSLCHTEIQLTQGEIKDLEYSPPYLYV